VVGGRLCYLLPTNSLPSLDSTVQTEATLGFQTGAQERLADENEIFIERIFRRYLRYFVEHSPVPMKLTYIPAGLVNITEEVMTSPSVQLVGDDKVKGLELRVLTPLFYSRYVHYPSCLHALISESQLLNSTTELSDPGLVSALTNNHHPSSPPFSSRWEKVSFSVLRSLRTEAGKIENCETKTKTETADEKVELLRTREVHPENWHTTPTFRVYTESREDVSRGQNCVWMGGDFGFGSIFGQGGGFVVWVVRLVL
jgi:hypothetical protein